MVTQNFNLKRRYKESPDAPPPMDESWWEAVLMEGETHPNNYPSKSAPNGNNGRRPSNEMLHLEELDHEPETEFVVDWVKAQQLYEQDQVISLIVTGFNRGGLLVSGEGLQGFVPLSHLVEAPCGKADPENLYSDQWLNNYLEQTLDLKVIECDQERGRVVFSERAAQALPGSRKRLLENLKPGNCVIGTVTNITDFGIFVDLGGVEGLIHVSEISWGRVHHPGDVVKLGQEVNVYVIHVEQDRARIALSLKRMYPNPWETAEQRYFPGQITEAVVTSIVPFGAFARLEEGLDGLIHISEISQEEGENLGSMLQEGQNIRVRVLHVDATRQRLGLSLKLD